MCFDVYISFFIMLIDIKFIVLFVYVVQNTSPNNYCEICRNHTLCLFSDTSPGIACKSYNNTALLTTAEVNEIVNRINERRNNIAVGLNNILPQAANMKKIIWSFELAVSAQRWVDQCDPSLQPDREDQCRDLAYSKVGQNIATILGPSPGLHVKSFVEMWYIQILKYNGLVTYYNQSRHHNTDYFTQLIWAKTDSVGCGKARFYVENKNTIVERLVCNFAPKGNIHGKPIYTIGYPSTQCRDDMIPDSKYTGLCVKRSNNTGRKFTTQRSGVSSLLRILNLSNSSVKQEIDPIRNNFRQINNASYKSKDQRNQKIRHVYFNHSHGDMKRVSPVRKQNFWNPSMNYSYINHNQQERGHSRVYHGYEAHVHNNHDNHETQDESSEPNFRKYDHTTNSINSYSSNDFRKYGNQNYQCTRKIKPPMDNYAAHECNTPPCTRGQKCTNCNQLTTFFRLPTPGENMCSPPNCNSFTELCPCNKHTTTCYTTPTRCTCDTNCRCVNVGFTTCCSELLRIKDNVNQDETRKSQEYKLYNLPAALAVRSGNDKSPTSNSSPKSQLIYKNEVNKMNRRIQYDEYHEQVKEPYVHTEFNDEDHDYLYDTFVSSGRNKRNLEDDITFKPFWEIDQYNQKRPLELKSIRYTTLGFKTRKNTKRATATSKPKIVTESITFTTKTYPITRGIKEYVSEKYLSFDELMRLRKFTAEETYQNARRKASEDNILRQENNSSSPTAEITTNTPFERKKHCTRKLTCTWTAMTMFGGEVIGGGGVGGGFGFGGFDRGSRTPPGYVEGCTRTSTCTREFMDRNKISTIPDTFNSSEIPPEDEDYCERRALNVQRRNLQDNIITKSTIDNQEAHYVHYPLTTTETNYDTVSTTELETAMFVPQYGCVCNYESSRIKRNGYVNYENKLFKDNKHIFTKVTFQNDDAFRKTRDIKPKNFINYLENSLVNDKCVCNGASDPIAYCILYILILWI